MPARVEFASMIINCPSCKGRYKVDPAQFGPNGRRVRCTACGNLWTEKPPEDFPQPVEPEALQVQDGPEPVSAAQVAADWGVAGSLAHAGEAPGEKRSNARGWAALGIVVAAIFIVGALARESIVRTWPPAQRLYMAIGFPAVGSKPWLNIEVVSHDQAIKGGRTVLVVKGKVTNTSDEVRDVPKLQAWIRAADARELANWTFSANQARLLPGETARFVTRFQNPPPGAAALSIDFSTKGK
jgi:predicted Zn finger-like uncharacterized protein